MVMVCKPRMLLDRFHQTAAALYHAFERVNDALGEPFFPKIVEEVAHEFQLAQVDPVAPVGSTKIDTDIYNS